MGRRVVDVMRADTALQLVGAVSHAAHPALGRDAGEVAGVGPLGVSLTHNLVDVLPPADVIIDFSVPEATITYLRTAADLHKAMVIGTTGFTAAQREEIGQLSQRVPCLVAPNMSVGVQVMFQLLQQLVTLLGPDYDVEILEMHHRMKVDAPSGTALRMAAIVAEALGRKVDDVAVYERRGVVGRRSANEIGMQAVRAGDIVGEHTVIFGGIGERLELVHRSQSRDTFAQGALRAAKWIVRQPPGLYGMEDLLRS
jgi:4-hydroxy-tetrahydrodipicolinate reductase